MPLIISWRILLLPKQKVLQIISQLAPHRDDLLELEASFRHFDELGFSTK
jgi:hypothetical protein